MALFFTPNKTKTSAGQHQFKRPMTFSPRRQGARPSPSKVDIWKEQLGLEEVNCQEGGDGNSSNSTSDSEGHPDGNEVGRLRQELELRNKHYEELCQEKAVLAESNKKYEENLSREETSRWQQLRMLQKIQESKLAEKNALIKTLEQHIAELDKHSNIATNLEEEKENCPPQQSVLTLVRHIERLQAENSRLMQEISQQNHVPTHQCTNKLAMRSAQESSPQQDHTMSRLNQICPTLPSCDFQTDLASAQTCPLSPVLTSAISTEHGGQGHCDKEGHSTCLNHCVSVSSPGLSPGKLTLTQDELIERLKKEKADLHRQVDLLEEQLIGNEKENHARLCQVTMQKSAAESEVRQLTAKLVELQARPSEVVHKIKRVESEVSALSLCQLQLALSQCEEEKSRIQQELKEKEFELSKQEQDIIMAKEKAENLKEKHKEEMKKMNEKLAEMSEQLNEQETLLAVSNENFDVTSANLKNLEQERQSLVQQIDDVQQRNVSLSAQVNTTTRVNEDLLVQLSSLHEAVSDKDELVKQVSELTLQKTDTESLLSKALSHITALQQQVSHYEQELISTEAQMNVEREAWMKERAAIEARLSAEYQARVSSLTKQLHVLSTGLGRLRDESCLITHEYHELRKLCLHFPVLVNSAVKSVFQAVRETSEHCEEMELRYQNEMRLRKLYHNQLVDLKGSIRVFCRLRPRIPEDGQGSGSLEVVTPDLLDDSLLTVEYKGRKQTFTLDRVFTASSTQDEVFSEVETLVTSCIDGYNVCIFAYGQTGSGKTYTMEGTPDEPGINQQALHQLFVDTAARAGGWTYTITVSMLEIYNETIRDLLCVDSGEKLEIKMDSDGSLCVPGLTWLDVNTVDLMKQVFAVGERNRATASTNMNEHSSRSHALLCIQVDGINIKDGSTSKGKLNLVDLAGSERVGKSGAGGTRLKEAQCINKSLSCLGDVIHALRGKQSHIPYRNSRLTYLLQDSLGGNSKTLMFVQASPVEKNVGETIASLNFAQRVRCVELGQASKRLDNNEIGVSTPPSNTTKTPARRK